MIKLKDILTQSNYKIIHTSFTDAVKEAQSFAKKRGYTVDPQSWSREITMNGGYNRARPSRGKTHEFHIELLKNNKPQRQALHISVYGMESGNFELNAYIR